MNNRIDSLITALQRTSLQAVALNPGPTLTYLTGLQFHLMERPTVLILSREGKSALILPQLESAKVGEDLSFLQCFSFGDNPSIWAESFSAAVKHLGLSGGEIGLEANRLRFLELEYLTPALPAARFVNASDVFSSLRLQKDLQEIGAMKKAAQIAQTALAATLPTIQIGQTEREIASRLVMELFRAGSDTELPFAPIVSGGPNSANPHATPSERPIQNGDLLVIDWGAAFQGYFSDLTRTFAIGQIEPEFQRIHELVQAANAAGRAASAPGMRAGLVDDAARKVIDAGGYGKYFTHRVGHGLGMEAHEEPYMFAENSYLLRPGNTFTVEPGIYLPERGGVRIEDDMVITSTSAESLSDFERGIITLPM